MIPLFSNSDRPGRARRRLAPLMLGGVGLLGLLALTARSQAGSVNMKVNFQPAAAPVPTGYSLDSGAAYDDTRGYGWVRQDSLSGTHVGLDLSPNTRDRNRTGVDQRLDTIIHMQFPSNSTNTTAVKIPGAWEAAVPSGYYRVTVSAGDQADAVAGYDSQHTLNVEGVPAITRFQPTATNEYQQATVTARVVDGRLTIDAVGGTNTKLNYVDIATWQRPYITSSTPANGAVDVARNAFVSCEVRLPNVGAGVNQSTLNAGTVNLTRTTDGALVPANLNTSGGGDVIVLQPTVLLDPNTQYTFRVTDGLKDVSGASFIPYTASFTTGTASGGGSSTVAFNKVDLPTASGGSFASLAIGPDGKLYASTLEGNIVRFPLNADGTTGTPQTIATVANANGGPRAILGLRFAPAATASSLVLWVSHSDARFENADDWAGKISKMSGPNLENYQDVVVNLPRSIRDHMTNSIDFGPDGALYVNQGSNTAMGEPDNAWGLRPERLLSAAVLRVNVAAIGAATVDVKTEEGGTYNPGAAGAPVTIYARGVRNAFDLVWHSNGKLYVPTNGSAAGGNTPTSAGTACGGNAPGITNVTQTQDDFLFRIEAGGYYGHPNPRRCEFIMNGGNPTAGADPAEVRQYPVGTPPESNWRGFAFNFGAHYSPNGVIEYKSGTFGGALRGKLIVCRYSGGDDLIVLTPGGPNNDIIDAQTGISGMTGLVDPLDIVENPANGNLYVSELGAGKITLLSPSSSTNPNIVTAPERLIFSDVQGGAASAAQAVTISNTGSAPLNIAAGGLTITGPNADQFQISQSPALPATIAPGTSAIVNIVFNPTSAGPKGAFLSIASNDPDTPTTQVTLRGLGALGLGGSNEPSLQWILDTFQIPVNAGDPNPADNALPTTALIGDEVPLQRFQKIGEGIVTIEPIAVYGPTAVDPTVRFGWYNSGNPASKQQLGAVPSSSGQTLNPVFNGVRSFDPGEGAFGFYSIWPFFSSREVFSEDQYNTFDANVKHHLRVYPLKEKNGTVVPNAYIVATEEHNAGHDYQDIVVIVRNVRPAPAASLGEIEVQNSDGVPFPDRLVFSRIGSYTSPPINGVHNVVTLRIKNSGAGPLTITGLPIVGDWELASAITLPATIAAGGQLDVAVRFKATAGDLRSGTLTVQSDDADEPSTRVELSGFWQSIPEGNQEPDLVEVGRTFGYATIFVGAGQILNQQGKVEAVGDEVLSPYWQRADASQPVSVRQLAAYHRQETTASAFWFAKGTTTTTRIVTHDPNFAQTLLPTINGSTTLPAQGSFSPTGVFGFKIDNEWSDPTKNNQTPDVNNGCSGECGHHVRFWPARDRSGALMPNTWLVAMDYSGINYDYNDNVYLVTNMRPENPAVDPNTPALFPGSPSLVLEFDRDYANTLVDVNGETTGFTSVQPNRTGTAYQPNLLDVNRTAPGTLAVQSAAGSNFRGENALVNGLRLAFDGRAAKFVVSGKAVGPLNGLNQPGQQAGIMFGPDQDNYIKLTAGVNAGTTAPVFQFMSEIAGIATTLSAGTPLPTPATLTSLELILLADPATGKVTPAYRAVTASGDSGVVTLSVPVTLSGIARNRFFAPTSKAGLLVSHGTAASIRAVFDRFAITPGETTETRPSLARIDVGSATTYTTTDGRVWSPDTGLFSPSTAIAETRGTPAIENTLDDRLYQTYRGNVGNSTPQNARVLTFNIPLDTPRRVDVRLHFAELYWGAPNGGAAGPGRRVFDVLAEGQTILDNFDITAAAGGALTAVVVPIEGVQVSDGVLTLTFKAEIDFASIAAIEVLASPGTVADTTPPARPAALSVTAVSTGLRLDWADNTEPDLAGYNVYRAASASGPWTQLNTKGLALASAFTDTRAPSGATSYYRVTAVDRTGNESAPATGSALRPAATGTYTQLTWTTVAPNPLARSEAMGGVVNGKLWVFGGYYSTAFDPSRRVDVYTPSTNTWARGVDMPDPSFTHAGTTVVGTDFYFAGGYYSNGTGGQIFASRNVWKFSTTAGTWTAMTPLPYARGAGTLVVLNNELHFFGGSNSSRVDTPDHWALPLSGGTAWRNLASLPNPRNHLGGVVLNGKIYAVGGAKGHDDASVAQTSVHVYDPASPSAWTVAATLPRGRDHISGATVIMDGRIIVLGGEIAHNSPVSDVTAFNPASSWTALTPLPAVRSSGVAGVINGVLYYTTGATPGFSNTTYKGVPVTTAP